MKKEEKRIKEGLMQFILRFFTLCVFLSVGAVLVLQNPLHAQPYTDIVAFGDSLTDFGGLAVYSGDFPEIIDDFPESLDYIPEALTNDRVWIQYLADEWDADLDNNAIGGAKTDRHTSSQIQELSDIGVIPDLSYLGQVSRFIDEDKTFLPADTLFAVWIGGNDFLGFDLSQGDQNQFVNETIRNIRIGLNALAEEAGARNFLVLKLPDMGKIPEYNDNTEISEKATALASDFNLALENTLADFTQANPGVRVYVFDVFDYINELIASGIFTNTTGTYLELDEDGDWTGDFNGPADDFIFWDEIHPTDRTHELLAQEAARLEASPHIVLGSSLPPPPTDDDNSEPEKDDDSTCFITIIAAQ
jgi:phospholipase/lecithinase/hemolysin